MSYFFVNVLQAFLPVALLIGLSWVHRPLPGIRSLGWATLLAWLAGTLIGGHLPSGQIVRLCLTVAELAALVLFLLCQFSRHQRLALFWQCLLITGAALHWADHSSLTALTSATVVNTDFLLNISAIVLALATVILCAVLTTMLSRTLPAARWPLLLLLSLLLALPLSGNLLLLLMKLQVLGLTKSLLSYVAQVTNASAWLSYFPALLLILLLLLLLPGLFALRKIVGQQTDDILRRKAQAEWQNARRTALWMGIVVVIVVLSQLYWDRIASQPPQLSAAVPVTLAEDGQVHIPLDQIRDGKLHRFVWVSDDGKAVRFFVINRYPDRLRLGVVFDACLLCGDQGYVMEGNQVICVACAVHIFIPSIGKPGGCNPIPIEGWKNDDRELVIGRDALITGVNYFTTVVTLHVKDPVDGSHLTNISAQYKFRYGGKTWFFSSEDNYNRFRAQPRQFVDIAPTAEDGEPED
ncbi:Fe-S-containing protein [Rahnella sp. RcJ3]|uniref:Fe-S-containing protein n=1 Tax=Rahnella sp. RcJ3 TaxID=2292446 RepID=UPI001294DF83|nr:Fe-S-containing protein [Rahnella sp. RcJ3]MQB56125.1 DUF2318 domain-containing protein [Rahnella sp. RcJ3]